jgi:hypothetical protein
VKVRKVTVEVPELIAQFVKNISALERISPEQWYQNWIIKCYQAIADNGFVITELDPDWMKQEYGDGR